MGAIEGTPYLEGPNGPPHEDTLYYWAKRYASSTAHAEEHPEDPWNDAELEYCIENMQRHIKEGVR